MFKLAAKPPLYLKQKSRRQRVRKMTIAAGFVCSDGLVLCADTQESRDPIKLRVPKLLVFPRLDVPSDRRIVIAGAGDAPMIDKLAEMIWRTVSSSDASMQAIADAVEHTIIAEYERLFGGYQAGILNFAQLIYGIWVKGNGVSMYQASGPVINETKEKVCIGVGEILAHHIADRMFVASMRIAQVELLASYMLSHVKEYVEGCGGDTLIVSLHDDGTTNEIDKLTELQMSGSVRNMDTVIQAWLFSLIGKESDEEFERALVQCCSSVRSSRNVFRELARLMAT